ncbi:hypothetical protein H9I45_04815 [Polaribacter haliotis]|uniref:tRNA_anti-like n=1 Tax=Polaribacter haliotis TaxID=1888915 RepID=A0A7L8AID6_9FLAO|nr:hypothetical protein [Polaribacter haliotis]QOD61772.1 hypothetical protein H9I45_04815 [Polaribacter haliotis]
MKHKYLSIALLVLLVVVFFGYNYMYKNHRNISNENAHYKLNVENFYKNYKESPKIATKKFLDKTIELTGTVTEIESDNFMMDDKVIFYTDSLVIKAIFIGKKITVKGRSIGYDELLENPKIDQTTITN